MMPPLMNNELARRENGRIELRQNPLRLRWNFDDLVTADGHKLHCNFTASAVALDQSAERQLLEEVFLGRGVSVTADAVVAHFTPAMRAEAARIAGRQNAADWIEGDAKQSMIDALAQAARTVAFSAGIEILSPFEIAFESPSFQSQKVEAMERTLAERRVAGQVEHFERASNLLKHFHELRESAPELSPSDILKQISPVDQGQMLQTLLLAAGKSRTTANLWAVAGPSLIKIDGRSTPATLELVTLPQTLGPLRSVQPARLDGSDVLLVGARCGIISFDSATGQSLEYADHSIDSPQGFSKAVVWNGQIWGCHGDAGVVSWKIGRNSAPESAIRPGELRGADNPPPLPTTPSPATSMSISTRTSGIRNLTPLDEHRLALSVGHSLTILHSHGPRSAVPLAHDSEIAALFVDGARLVVVQDDGTVSLLDRLSLALISRQRRCGRVTAAAMLPWLGSNRLLIAGEDGPIYCVGLDDELVTTYLSSHRGLRVLTATPDLLAAVSSDRQRIVLWNSWDGKQPLAELSVVSAARHRVGDIEFA